jgi:dTDP-4-amino-4,6-dideoxygalactose transaminase
MKYFGFNDIYSFIKGIFINQVTKFEQNFANYIGTKHAIATSFGRTALFAGLKAINVKNGEVIIPSFICTVVRHAVVLADAKPVFADINYHTFEYDISDLRKKITKKTKVIIVVHYFGGVAQNLNKIVELAKEYKIFLIEDCAHSLGAQIKGKKVGSMSDLAIFSLTKNLINCGGGVMTTNNDNIAVNSRRILLDQKISLKKRIADFPLILIYGYDQFINKIILDRIKKRSYEKLLFKFSDFMRNFYRFFFKILSKTKPLDYSLPKNNINQKKTESNIEPEPYKQGIHMEPIIASLGIHQLNKIDKLNAKREKISESLKKLKNIHPIITDREQSNQVNTNVLLEFKNSNLFEINNQLKEFGINLKTTWPTHQKIWEDQDSTNLRKFEKNILVWNVNPDTTLKEINKFQNAIETINNMNQNVQ